MNPKLNEVLKWSIENSATSGDSESAAPLTNRNLDPTAFAALFGGPSEGDLMKAAIEVISSTDPEVTLDNKLIAFDNLEQLIESLDNANLLTNLSLWTPLLSCLEHEEQELRKMAAWCVGTAVQNHAPSQERLFAMGGIPTLVELATKDEEHRDVRRKAVYALSSACRNYQPATDACVEVLIKYGSRIEKIDANDMDAMDSLMNDLRSQLLQ
jgi:hsp70-interacting protein